MQAFELETRVVPPVITAGSTTEVQLLLDVRALEMSAPVRARDAATSICFVFDCSYSTAGRRRAAAIQAAKTIVDHIDARHPISLIGFATEPSLIVDNTKSRDKIKSKIEKLRKFALGSTNLARAIRYGVDVVQRVPADARVLVILSDGGADDEQAALEEAARAAKAGVQLFAVGAGEDYDAERLQKLVAPSNGAVFAGGIEIVFKPVIDRIERFVATNARLEVRIGDELRELTVGNVEPGRTNTFQLSTRPPAGRGTLELARATLTYDVPMLGLHGQSIEVSWTANVIVPEKHLYDVVLVSAKGSEITFLRELRELTGRDLSELNDLVARAPIALMEAVPQAQAAELKTKLEASGALIELRRR